MVRALFFAGHETVIFDSMNLDADARRFWLPTSDCPWDLEYLLVQTPGAICIERAKACGREYLVPVIQNAARLLGDYGDDDFEGTTKDDWNETDFIRSERHEG
jgi:hypothetical protein